MEYRLIEIEYRNRIQYDEGPGSFKHVVADERKRILDRGTVEDGTSTEDLLYMTKYCLPHHPEDGPEGARDNRYVIEIRMSGNEEWEFLISFHNYGPENPE